MNTLLMQMMDLLQWLNFQMEQLEQSQIPDMPQGAPVDSGRTPDWDPSQMDEKNKRRH